MPGYRGHILGGIAAGCGLLAAATGAGLAAPTPGDVLAVAGAAACGALFPDVDTDSKGQNLYYGVLLVADAWLIWRKAYALAAVIGLLAMLPAAGRHRGWTHRWWAAFLVPLPILLLPAFLAGLTPRIMAPTYAAAVAGYISHLILDSTVSAAKRAVRR